MNTDAVVDSYVKYHSPVFSAMPVVFMWVDFRGGELRSKSSYKCEHHIS